MQLSRCLQASGLGMASGVRVGCGGAKEQAPQRLARWSQALGALQGTSADSRRPAVPSLAKSDEIRPFSGFPRVKIPLVTGSFLKTHAPAMPNNWPVSRAVRRALSVNASLHGYTRWRALAIHVGCWIWSIVRQQTNVSLPGSAERA